MPLRRLRPEGRSEKGEGKDEAQRRSGGLEGALEHGETLPCDPRGGPEAEPLIYAPVRDT